jgi:hypothetical protein
VNARQRRVRRRSIARQTAWLWDRMAYHAREASWSQRYIVGDPDGTIAAIDRYAATLGPPRARAVPVPVETT